MKTYPTISDIQNIISKDGTAHLTYHATELQDIIHEFSMPGYEYLSGGLVAFLNRFKPILPKKSPIVLEITGKQFTDAEKETIDNAIWMQYGLYLSEAAENMKKIRFKILLYLFLMVLSSVFLFLVANNSDEVVVNYGYLLFWFFAYRLLTHLLLDCIPIYREYQWYQRLASLKLLFSDDIPKWDAKALSRESAGYAREALRQAKKHQFVDRVLMEDSCVSLGCSIHHPEDVLMPSGAGNLEIVSDEMTDYLLGALPFIKQKSITKLEIACDNMTESYQNRIASALRNQMGFLISNQDDQQKANRNTSFLFAACLVISTAILYAWGKNVDVAVHEFFLVLFWFFGDYLLEFILLSRLEIHSTKKILEKLTAMDITFIKKTSE